MMEKCHIPTCCAYVILQLGCFVPATSAQLRIADRIFTRIGTNDSIEKEASSFIMEVK